jgi:two-component system NarL family sensor kinase
MVVIINNFRRNLKRQKETFKVIFETQEKERQRIAQDLHDNQGVMLSTIRLYIESLSDADESEKEEIRLKAQAHVGHALVDLKETVLNLTPKSITHNGFIAEINDLAKVVQLNNHISVSLVVDGTMKRYSPQLELNIYRILQELLNNTLKYAQATKIEITVHFNPTHLSIYYNDNGIGFDSQNFKSGHGFKNMNARVAAYKGFFDIRSEERKGSHFKIIFEEKNLIHP